MPAAGPTDRQGIRGRTAPLPDPFDSVSISTISVSGADTRTERKQKQVCEIRRRFLGLGNPCDALPYNLPKLTASTQPLCRRLADTSEPTLVTAPPGVSRRQAVLPGQASLDALWRAHVRSFTSCLLIFLFLNVPTLIFSVAGLERFLSRMSVLFSVVAGVAAVLAARSRQRVLSASLTLWDEAAAFLARAIA